MKNDKTYYSKGNIKRVILNERLNIGQTMNIEKIAQFINTQSNSNRDDFSKLFSAKYFIKSLKLKDTKKSDYQLTQLLFHITLYALKNDDFLSTFNIK